jgi:hypothetical protein
MDAATKAQLASARYREVLLQALGGTSAEQLAHLADRAILAAAVITEEFKRRYPAEFEAWDGFADSVDNPSPERTGAQPR